MNFSVHNHAPNLKCIQLTFMKCSCHRNEPHLSYARPISCIHHLKSLFTPDEQHNVIVTKVDDALTDAVSAQIHVSRVGTLMVLRSNVQIDAE